MKHTAPRSEAARRSETTIALGLLALISSLALGGILLFVVQERGRVRILAEYRAFQLASELVQSYDRGESTLFPRVEGLLGFGLYNQRGEELYRYGSAPVRIEGGAAQGPVRVEGDEISLVRFLGGAPMMRGRMRPQRDAAADPALSAMPMGPPSLGRFVFLRYRVTAFRRGELALYGGAALVALALLLAFAGVLRLAAGLDAYRAQEARNRELVALGEVARTLSHEIKNPLGVLRIQCALLRREAGEGLSANVRVIEEEVTRLSLLTDRVRRYLSTNPGKAESFSAAEYLRSYAPRYGDRVSLGPLPEEEVRLRMDRGILDQILDNLVANGLESMEGRDGEPLELSCRVAKNGRLELAVADRGGGIPPEDAARIYDLFYTTKTTGSGLGLALSRRYAELSGGSIRHSPRAGGGTVFTVELPMSGGRRGA